MPDLIRWVLGVKYPGRNVDPKHFHPMPRLRMCGAVHLQQYAFVTWTGTVLLVPILRLYSGMWLC